MRDARAAIVRDDGEAIEAERFHHRDLVRRHRALGVIPVFGVTRRLAAVTIAPEVGGDDGEAFRKLGRDLVPCQMGLRMPVEQQQRRPAATDRRANMDIAGIDVLPAKAGHQLGIFGSHGHCADGSASHGLSAK